MASILDGKRLISESILGDIADAIREKCGYSQTIKPVDMADLIRGIGEEAAKQWHVWYMSNIAPIDGMYNSHSYSNVYVVGDELVVLYRSAPHHFSGSDLVTMRCTRLNLDTWKTETYDALTGVNYFGSVYHDGVYYIFDQSRKRFTTTDFRTFEESAYTTPATEPYYIAVGDNNRFISAHSNSQAKGTMMYSDDLGITWLRATGDDVYVATLTSHGACTKVGDTIVAYCQSGKNDTATDNTTTLNVLTSTDNGLTWSGAEVVDEDLKYPGPSFTSGMFAQIDDEWFLCLSSRLRYTDDGGNLHIGNVRLFKGTDEEVISGNMHLYAVVDDFDCGTKNVHGANSVIMTDTGNIGMTTDGKALYIVYAKPLMASDDICSNNMLALSVVNTSSTDIIRPDAYHNANWEAERDAFVAAKDTAHDLYIYGDGSGVLTNVKGIEIATQENYNPTGYTPDLATGNIAPLGDIVIPFTERFEMRMVQTIANRYVNSAYKSHYYGINVGGKKHALHGSVNDYYFNKTNETIGAASLTTHNGVRVDFALRYENGQVTATLNGDTIEDVRSYVAIDIDRNPDSNTAVLSFSWVAEMVSASAKIGAAVEAIVIDTDGDISGLLGTPAIDPEIPVYNITNALTNCTNSNVATQINEGSAYEAQLTAANGYQLDTVAVTMGGTDVTSEVYADGAITIAAVTGDIVITATAEAIPVPDPVTDGLIHYLNPDDITQDGETYSWPAEIGGLTLTPASYDATTRLATFSTAVDLGNSDTLGVGDQITFDFVVNMTTTNTALVHSQFATYNADINVYGNKLYVADTGYAYTSWGDQHVFATKILHLTVCADYANGTVLAYVNGKLEVEVSAAMAASTARKWYLVNGGSNLGDVRIYNRILNADEVSTNYANAQGKYTFDVVN